ncbi:MAG: tRNA lysidine(34) synthetase TilS [Candidatus Binatia bacterium]
MAKVPFVRKVAGALERVFPQVRGARLGVAVSGGPDSVALLAAVSALVPELRCSLRVLHVNHGLRDEAEDEQKLVEGLCERWQVPCDVTRLVPRETHTGIEAWARSERYRFFGEIRDQQRLAAVLLAHTLDDQAETVLFRCLRGSGRRGLAGIPPVRDGWIVRPLLDCTRQEILEFLHAQRLPFALDKSNADVRHTRNRIRHRLIPLLEREFSPRIRSHLATLARIFREEEQWLDEITTAARERVLDAPEVLSLSRLGAEPPTLQLRILRQWVERQDKAYDVTFAHLMRLQALGTGDRTTGIVELPGAYWVRREGETFVLENKRSRETVPTVVPHYCYVVVPGQELTISAGPGGRWHIKVSPAVEWKANLETARLSDPWCSLFDLGKLNEGTVTLTVRNFRRGDRLQPLGLRGHKKVQDIFVDAKILRSKRQFWPLVVMQGEIAWVPGCVRGEQAKIRRDTHIVCRMEIIPLPEK